MFVLYLQNDTSYTTWNIANHEDETTEKTPPKVGNKYCKGN